MMRQNMRKLMWLIFGLSLLLSVPLHVAPYSFKVEAAQKSRSRKPRRSPPAQVAGGDAALARAFEQRASNIQVEGQGVVLRVLSDDNDGSRHQRFIVTLASGQTLLISHNIDLAPRVAGLRKGDVVEFSGEYEWNAKGGVIHWTHRDPARRHQAGWIKHNGELYQ
jgi:membrane protein implicated in regulation of membrane protease activity